MTFIHKIVGRWKSLPLKIKKYFIAGCIILALLTIGITITVLLLKTGAQTVSYQEAQVIKGMLSKGITETGSVDVGTTVQTFDLDISEYTTDSSFSWEGTGSMDFQMPGSTFSMQGGSESSSDSSSNNRQLSVEEVYIEAGQEIKKGDAILKLTEESVNSIRTELSADVSEAQVVYEQTKTTDRQTKQEAEGALSLNTLYGAAAQSEYDSSVSELQEAVEEKQENLNQANENLLEAEEKLASKEELLKEEKQVLANAVYTAAGTDRENLYWWVVALKTETDAKEMVETLETDMEELQENITEYTKAVSDAQTDLELANKALESGSAEALIQSKKRSFQYEHAQEIYDVTVEQSDYDTEIAKKDYEEANEKLNDFDTEIVEQMICAGYDGLVTEVSVTAGDTLTQDKDLFTLYDYDAVTITLSIEEGDMEEASLGSQANVTFAAFPEQVFKGKVTEIGDAEIDSNTNTTLYSVTVTVEEADDLLYQDMSADVTFVTEETEEVLYVPIRAVTEENGDSYVKIKSESGAVSKKKVVTGFTDGIHVEIKEGISEGETVLLESKVKSA